MKKIKELFKKICYSILVTVIAFIPFWIYLVIKLLASPSGFWQNLVLAGIGLFFLGTIQLILFFAWIMVLYVIWGE